jgi:1,4-dihydroxy-2-naphthoate octaprenyltransferase
MTKKQAWLKAIRLRTLPLSLAGIIMGAGLAQLTNNMDWLLFYLALSTTILFQILSNLANDLGDGMKGTDNLGRIGPERAIQSGIISIKEMKLAVVLTSLLSLVSAALLLFFGAKNLSTHILLIYVILAIFCVLAAITYTVGKKAYGYFALGDLMVFIFFGCVSVLGVYTLFSQAFDWNFMFPAVSIGFLSVAVLNLNNMRDISSDRKAGKNTLVVKIGADVAKMYHLLVLAIAFGTYFYFIDSLDRPILYISMLPFTFVGFHAWKVMKTKSAKDFDPELKTVALSTFGITVLFFALSFINI